MVTSVHQVDLKHVYFRYANTKENILEDINMSVKQGELIVLIGNSGCGKSSLLRVINGLIPNFYEGELTGSITINGCNALKMSIGEIGKHVSSIFQDTKSQFFTTNTTSEIVFAAQNYGVAKDILTKRVNTIYHELNLASIWNKSIFSLSAGQRQKTAFAGSEILHPDIYVLDEPSANLDMEAILTLRKRLEYLKKAGKTMIIAEHRLFYLHGLADRFVLLKRGKALEISHHGIADFSICDQKKLRCLDIDNLHYQYPVYHPSKPFFSFSSLRYTYSKTPLLDTMSASIACGEITTIIGTNGVGKTTLCKIIAGLIPSQTGTFTIDGKKVKPANLYRYSYFVMQEADYQLFTDSCIKELTLGLPKTKAIEKKAEHILSELSMQEYCDVHPQALSGGQKQRIVIAGAICTDKPMIILDEPTSGLDKTNMYAIARILQKEARKGKAVVVITHDPELIACVSHRILEIKNGLLVERSVSSQAEFLRLCKEMMGETI